MFSSWLAFLWRFTIKDFRFGIDRDTNRNGRRLEMDWLVKARRELPRRLIDENYSRAFIDTNDAAKFFIDANDVVYAKSEWIVIGSPDEAEKFGLFAVLVHGAPHQSNRECTSSLDKCSASVPGFSNV